MDYSSGIRKDVQRGRKVALATRKKQKLITCWVDEDLRDEVNKVCPNVSEFIRVCLEQLVKSPIEKQLKTIYKDIAVNAANRKQDNPTGQSE